MADTVAELKILTPPLQKKHVGVACGPFPGETMAKLSVKYVGGKESVQCSTQSKKVTRQAIISC